MTKNITGLVVVVVGVIFALGGGIAWGLVSNNLASQHVVVSEDATHFAGEPVDGPLTAYAQQAVIEHHILEATGGKTFAQMDREDPKEGPLRASMVQPGEALRAGLFTSILAFGVSALAAVLGIVLAMIGVLLTRVEE
jgi:hypothetical protein